jgi:hypothetical protein
MGIIQSAMVIMTETHETGYSTRPNPWKRIVLPNDLVQDSWFSGLTSGL